MGKEYAYMHSLLAVQLLLLRPNMTEHAYTVCSTYSTACLEYTGQPFCFDIISNHND